MNKVIKKFTSKKNEVTLVENEGRLSVAKKFSNSEACERELLILKKISGKVNSATFYNREKNTIYMEYLGDITLLDILEVCEKECKTNEFLQAFDCLLDTLEKFYSFMKDGDDYYILNDINYRNFIYKDDKIFIIDYEDVKKGEIIVDSARIIAYVLLYNPILTKYKYGLAKRMLKACIDKFEFNMVELLGVISQQLEILIDYRQVDTTLANIINHFLDKIVICPDSFKGSMSSQEVVRIIKEEFNKFSEDIETVGIVLADGGEGTLAIFEQMLNVDIYHKEVLLANGHRGVARYMITDKKVAIIESAEVIGLPLMTKPNPAISSTYGIGELILDAINKGAESILLCLGGTATNDGGSGVLQAIGVEFKSKMGENMLICGENLINIGYLEYKAIPKIDIVIMCDVDNLLLGNSGASYGYAGQKGADSDMIIMLEEGMTHYATILYKQFGKDITRIKGVGAGGGISASLIAVFDAELKSGIEQILDMVQFEELIVGANAIITGEGKLDATSFRGKVIGGVLERANRENIPVVAVVGTIDVSRGSVYNRGIKNIVCTNKLGLPFESIKNNAKQDLAFAIREMLDNTILI